jgi:hypothetical protein
MTERMVLKIRRYMKTSDLREVFCRALSDEYHTDADALLDEYMAFSEGNFFHDYRALGAFIANKIMQRNAAQKDLYAAVGEWYTHMHGWPSPPDQKLISAFEACETQRRESVSDRGSTE